MVFLQRSEELERGFFRGGGWVVNMVEIFGQLFVRQHCRNGFRIYVVAGGQ